MPSFNRREVGFVKSHFDLSRMVLSQALSISSYVADFTSICASLKKARGDLKEDSEQESSSGD